LLRANGGRIDATHGPLIKITVNEMTEHLLVTPKKYSKYIIGTILDGIDDVHIIHIDPST
jgi:hypothetical protein